MFKMSSSLSLIVGFANGVLLCCLLAANFQESDGKSLIGRVAALEEAQADIAQSFKFENDQVICKTQMMLQADKVEEYIRITPRYIELRKMNEEEPAITIGKEYGKIETQNIDVDKQAMIGHGGSRIILHNDHGKRSTIEMWEGGKESILLEANSIPNANKLHVNQPGGVNRFRVSAMRKNDAGDKRSAGIRMMMDGVDNQGRYKLKEEYLP